MIFAHPLLWRKIAEHVTLLLIGSSHAHWTHHALLRCKNSEFFSSLLGNSRNFLTPASASLEHFPYRQLHMFWRLQGLWQFARGDLAWKPLKRQGLESVHPG